MRTTATLLALASFCAAHAAEHHAATPTEVAAAARSAAPGDVIILADGTWRDARIRVEAEGSPAQPITLRPTTPGGVVITGDSMMRVSGRHIVIDGLRFERCTGNEDVFEFRTHSARHAVGSRLVNCAFIDCNPRDAKTETRWVSLYGADNLVDHCYLAGKTNRGATLVVWLHDQSARHRIEHNHFGPRPPLKVNGGETIRVGDSKTANVAAHCLIAENLFESCNGEVEIISNKSSRNVYRNNTFRRCEGALTLRHGDACTVTGNVFLGEGQPRTGGVRIIGAVHRVANNHFADLTGEETRAALCLMNGIPNSRPDGYFQVRHAIIESNTFVNCRQTFVLGHADEGGTLSPEDCQFIGNRVFSKHQPHVRTLTPLLRDTWRDNAMNLGSEAGLAPPPVNLNVGPAWKQKP